MHADGVGFGAAPGSDPRPKPTRDVRREMSDGLTRGEVNPDLRVFLHRWVGYQPQGISFTNGREVPLPATEDRTVNCRAERGRTPFRERRRMRLQWWLDLS